MAAAVAPEQYHLGPKHVSKLRKLMKSITNGYAEPTLNVTYEQTKYILGLTLKYYKANAVSMVDISGPTAVIGDIHGDWKTLYAIFNKLLFVPDKKCFKSTLKICLLGDYVDRGVQGLRCILFLFIWKLLRPQQFFPLRGNHETFWVNHNKGFLKEMKAIFGEPEAIEIHKLANQIFEYLPPFGLYDNQILLLHGGICSDMKSLSQLRNISMPIQNPKVNNILVYKGLWSDPDRRKAIVAILRAYFAYNELRAAGEIFNKQALLEKLKELRITLVIRGHENVTDGLDFFGNRKLITIFSSAHYDGSILISSVAILDGKGKIGFLQFKPEEYDENAENIEDTLTVDDQEVGKADGTKTAAPLKDNKKQSPSCIATTIAAAALILACIFGLFSYFDISTVGTTTGGAKYLTGPEFAEKTGMVARVVNGLSLSFGPLNEQKMIDELFPFESNGVVENVAKLKMSEFQNDVAAIQTVIGKECSGANGCTISDSVSSQLKKFEAVDKTFTDISKDLSGTEKFHNFLKIVTPLVKKLQADSKDSITVMIENLETLANNLPQGDDHSTEGYDAGTKIVEFHDPFKTYLEYTEDLTKFMSFLEDWNPIRISLKTSGYDDFWNTVKTLKTEIKPEKERYGRIGTGLNNDSQKQLLARLQFLSSDHSYSIGSKTLTSGFLNGVEDIKSLKTDHTNTWLIKLLNPGKDLSLLDSKIEPLIKFANKLDPLSKNLKEMEQLRDSGALRSMRTSVNHFSATSQLFDQFSKSEKCVDGLKIEPAFHDDMKKYIASFAPFDSELKLARDVLKKYFTGLKVQLPHFMETVELITTTRKKPIEFFKAMRGVKTFNETIASLKKLQEALNSTNFTNLETSMAPLFTPENVKTLSSFKTFSDKTRPQPAACLKTLSIELVKVNPEVESLKVLAPGSKSVESVVKHSTDLVKTVEEFNKVKSTSSRKPKRSVSDVPDKKTFKIRSREFGEYASAVRFVIEAKKQESHLETLVANKKTIDAVIEGVSDPEEKANLKKLWNDDVVKSLNTVLNAVKHIDQSIKDQGEFNRTLKFLGPFETVSTLSNLEIKLKSLAEGLDGRITDKQLSGSLNSLKTLEQLKFAKFETEHLGATVMDIDKFLNSLLGVERVECTGPDCKKEDPGFFATYWKHIFIPLAIVVALLIGGCLCRYCWNKRKGKSNVDPHDSKKPSKDKVITPVTPTPASIPTNPEGPMKSQVPPAPPKNNKKVYALNESTRVTREEGGNCFVDGKRKIIDHSPRPPPRAARGQVSAADRKKKEKNIDAISKKTGCKKEEIVKKLSEYEMEQEDVDRLRNDNVLKEMMKIQMASCIDGPSLTHEDAGTVDALAGLGPLDLKSFKDLEAPDMTLQLGRVEFGPTKDEVVDMENKDGDGCATADATDKTTSIESAVDMDTARDELGKSASTTTTATSTCPSISISRSTAGSEYEGNQPEVIDQYEPDVETEQLSTVASVSLASVYHSSDCSDTSDDEEMDIESQMPIRNLKEKSWIWRLVPKFFN